MNANDRPSSAAVLRGRYRFVLECFDGDGQLLREVSLDGTHFQRAVYDTCFDGVRKGVLARYDPPAHDDARIEPRFEDASAGGATVSGFRVIVPVDEGGEYARDFHAAYFRCHVLRVRGELARSGELAEDARLQYRVSAVLDDGKTAPRPKRFRLGKPQVCVDIRETPNDEPATAQSWDAPLREDVRVMVDRVVIDDVVNEAREAPDREVGGALLGYIEADPERRDVRVRVTASASGQGTVRSDNASVTFTPETFAQARKLIELRGAGEYVVGWYHSHPFRLCSACDDELAPTCINTKILFFSTDDMQVMEQAFDQPFHVALLAAVEPRVEPFLRHAPVRLFGWRKGELVSRGFEVVE